MLSIIPRIRIQGKEDMALLVACLKRALGAFGWTETVRREPRNLLLQVRQFYFGCDALHALDVPCYAPTVCCSRRSWEENVRIMRMS